MNLDKLIQIAVILAVAAVSTGQLPRMSRPTQTTSVSSHLYDDTSI